MEFENISMSVQVPVLEQHVPTIGSALVGIATPSPKRAYSVLQGCSGVLAPGSMTLVRVRVVALPCPCCTRSTCVCVRACECSDGGGGMSTSV